MRNDLLFIVTRCIIYTLCYNIFIYSKFIEGIIMQVLSSLKSAKNRHEDCQVVRRRGRTFVICKSNPRFKAVQGGKKKK